ncbi:MAG: Hpt domain-containing protein [Dechloromonas sp.]|nr:MAG: Hpt domain-containing protein [Dechloromonas sp.]
MADAFVLNRQDILERLGGDEEIYSMMLDMYVQDVDENCANLMAAIASGQAAEIRREAHTVKGLLATFSDDSGAAKAFAVEQQAKAGDLGGLAEAAAVLAARMREVAAVLAAARAAG